MFVWRRLCDSCVLICVIETEFPLLCMEFDLNEMMCIFFSGDELWLNWNITVLPWNLCVVGDITQRDGRYRAGYGQESHDTLCIMIDEFVSLEQKKVKMTTFCAIKSKLLIQNSSRILLNIWVLQNQRLNLIMMLRVTILIPVISEKQNV